MLGAILAISVTLRLIGVGHLLPMLREDDSHVFDQADILAGRVNVEEWDRPLSPAVSIAAYPHALALALIPFTRPEQPKQRSDVDTIAVDLECASVPYRRGRIVFVLLSALAIPLLWFASRRALGVGAALLASSFMAVSLLHLVISQQARPHGPFATFTFITMVAAVQYTRRPRFGIAMIVGLAAAIATGTLPFGWILLPSLLLAWILARRADGRRVAHLLVACAIVVLSIPLFYPFSRIGGGDLPLVGTHPVDSYPWQWRGLVHFPQLFLQYDPVLGVLAVLGVVILVIRLLWSWPPSLTWNGRMVLIVVAAIVPYWLAVGGTIDDQARFFAPLLPVAAALAALFVANAARVAARGVDSSAGKFVVNVLVFAAALSIPCLTALKYTSLLAGPSTLDHAAGWLRANANAREDRILLGSAITLPLYLRESSCGEAELKQGWRPWERYLHANPDHGSLHERFDVRRLDFVKVRVDNLVTNWETNRAQLIVATGARFIVVADTQFDRRFPLVPRIARPRWHEVARFLPFPHEPNFRVYFGYSDPEMFRRVWLATAWGPPLVIYEVER